MYLNSVSFLSFDYALFVLYFDLLFSLTIVSSTFMKQITFGKRLGEVRRSKALSQDDLAKLVSVQGDVIERYERDEVKPSIEMAASIARALEVGLDNLVGNTDLLLVSTVIKRINDIQRLDEVERKHVFALLNAFLRDSKAKKAYAA